MKSVVYVVTRQASDRTAVLLVTGDMGKADDFVESHVKFRTEREGSTLHVDQRYEPSAVPPERQVRVGGSDGHPTLAPADPVINCFRREVVLRDANGSRTRYRVVQHCVQ